MAWTNVNKPTTSGWTGVNPSGKAIYDDPGLTYDDSSSFYDSFNPNSWTNISKPSVSGWTNVSKPS